MQYVDHWLDDLSLPGIDSFDFANEPDPDVQVDRELESQAGLHVPADAALDLLAQRIAELPFSAAAAEGDSPGLSIASAFSWPDGAAPERAGPPDRLAVASEASERGGGASAKGDNNGKGGGKPPTDDTDPGDSAEPAFTFELGDPDTPEADAFNITLELYGASSAWTDALQGAFLDSATFLTSLIDTGLDDVSYVGSFADLESGSPTQTKIADDLVIEAYLSNIDGSGGVLGRAGPYAFRGGDNGDVTADSDGEAAQYDGNAWPSEIGGLSAAGIMEFDLADAGDLDARGLWDDTVFHEMMHVLGFGTLWDEAAWNLVGDEPFVDPGAFPWPHDDNAYYTYDSGTQAELANGDTIYVEANGGSGTARGHWDDVIYGNEIMTGYIDTGGNYLSAMSVAALADLGYDLASNDYAGLAAPLSQDIDFGWMHTA